MSGLLGSLRRVLDGAIELLQVRVELFATELEQEKLRLAAGLMWSALALLLLGLGIVMAALLVVVLLWDEHRVAALSTVGGVCLAGAALTASRARQRFASPDGPFPLTRAELRADRGSLSSGVAAAPEPWPRAGIGEPPR